MLYICIVLVATASPPLHPTPKSSLMNRFGGEMAVAGVLYVCGSGLKGRLKITPLPRLWCVSVTTELVFLAAVWGTGAPQALE